MNYSKNVNPRIVIPSHLRSIISEPGTFEAEGRLSFAPGEPNGFLQMTFHVERLTPVSESPKEAGPNLHVHARSNDPEHSPAAYGRHDHEAPPWGSAHRHMNSLRSRAVPPTVVGCTNVAHDKVDCFAAGTPDKELCRKCEAALGRKL